jgi:hypothetical protein
MEGTEMAGIKPGYRSKEPSEIFNSRPQPGPGLSAGAMGPKKETPALGMDGMMEPEEKSLSRDDLLLSVRKMRKYMDGKLEENEKKHQKLYGDAVTLIKAMTQEIKNLKDEISSYKKVLTDSSSTQSKLQGEQKSLRVDVDTRNDVFRKSIIDMMEKQFSDLYVYTDKKFQATTAENAAGVENLNKAFNMGLEAAEPRFKTLINNQFEHVLAPAIKALIQGMPVPIVNVPENAIKSADVQVNVPAPQITNNLENVKLLLSEKSFNLNVEQPAPHVHLPEGLVKNEAAIVNVHVPPQPEQKTPQVNVHVPEQPTPEVIVNNVPRRKVMKTFEYYPDGRPSKVLEEDMPEDK